MGQTLSEPIVEKRSQKGGDDTLLFGVSDMQGWRISMEDSHAAVLQLNGGSGKDKVSFFGVYDGHGGDAVAQFSGEHVHRIISQDTSFIAGDYEKALKNGFLNTDKAIREEPRFKEDPSGCTASVVLITGDGRVFCVLNRFFRKPLNSLRRMRVTQDLFFALEEKQNLCHLIISLKMKWKRQEFALRVDLLTLAV